MRVCPKCDQVIKEDHRKATWRYRVRLYNVLSDEPAFDTDSTRNPREPGAQTVTGLPTVAARLAELAIKFHTTRRNWYDKTTTTIHAEVKGLELPLLIERQKGLRTTLSRRGGDAVWRVQYIVRDASGEHYWMARVDLQREDSDAEPKRGGWFGSRTPVNTDRERPANPLCDPGGQNKDESLRSEAQQTWQNDADVPDESSDRSEPRPFGSFFGRVPLDKMREPPANPWAAKIKSQMNNEGPDATRQYTEDTSPKAEPSSS